MNKIIKLFFLLQLGFVCSMYGVVTSLRVNRLTNPSGIVDSHPMLSWQITSSLRNVMQTAYEIEVKKGSEVIWNTGKVMSDVSKIGRAHV